MSRRGRSPRTSISSLSSPRDNGTGNSHPAKPKGYTRSSSSDASLGPTGPIAADDRYLSVSALADTTDLVTLVRTAAWDAVAARCDARPSEASEAFTTTVRGGYTAKVTPLHLACERDPTPDAVQALIRACPDSVRARKFPGGQLPLHAACTWGAVPAVVLALLDSFPDGAKVRDDLSNLPLHCACYSGADEGVVSNLLQHHSRAVWVRNGQGSAPADITQRLRHPNRRVVLNLMESRGSDLVGDAENAEAVTIEATTVATGSDQPQAQARPPKDDAQIQQHGPGPKKKKKDRRAAKENSVEVFFRADRNKFRKDVVGIVDGSEDELVWI